MHSHDNKQPWDTFADLQTQKLPVEETFNVWCDRLAQLEWEKGEASQINPDVFPDKRWAVYSIYPQEHKHTGNLSTDILTLLGYNDTLSYICNKHNITMARLEKINLFALHTFLKNKQPSSMLSLSNSFMDEYLHMQDVHHLLSVLDVKELVKLLIMFMFVPHHWLHSIGLHSSNSIFPIRLKQIHPHI